MALPYEITAPDGRSGVVAGIAFTAGRAVAEDPPPGALLYFRRHGFTITSEQTAEQFPGGFVANERPAPAKAAPRARNKSRSSSKEE